MTIDVAADATRALKSLLPGLVDTVADKLAAKLHRDRALLYWKDARARLPRGECMVLVETETEIKPAWFGDLGGDECCFCEVSPDGDHTMEAPIYPLRWAYIPAPRARKEGK